MKRFGKQQVLGTLAVVAALAAGSAYAQGQMNQGSGAMDHAKMGEMKGAGQAAMSGADGEVRRIDKAAGKVTLRHGEIKEHQMPPMTMVFEVRDKAMLDAIKPGDKVNFKLINDNGRMIVTEIKPAG